PRCEAGAAPPNAAGPAPAPEGMAAAGARLVWGSGMPPSAAVRRAVTPAAGMGTRFLPATKAVPKEMLPVVDTPTIQYVVEEAVAAGLGDILLITGRGKGAIEDHFDRAPELEEVLEAKGDTAGLELIRRSDQLAAVHSIRQGTPKGPGHAVPCAAG